MLAHDVPLGMETSNPGNQLLSAICAVRPITSASRAARGPDLHGEGQPPGEPAGLTGLGIAAGALLKPQRSLRRRYAGHAPGVIGHHINAARFGDHEHPAGAAPGARAWRACFSQPESSAPRTGNYETVEATSPEAQQPGRLVAGRFNSLKR